MASWLLQWSKHNSTMHPMQVSGHSDLHDGSCKAYISSHTHCLVGVLLVFSYNTTYYLVDLYH